MYEDFAFTFRSHIACTQRHFLKRQPSILLMKLAFGVWFKIDVRSFYFIRPIWSFQVFLVDIFSLATLSVEVPFF